MKLSTSFALLAAATAAPRFAQAASLENLMSLIAQLEEEVVALQTEYEGKDDEIAALVAQLTACEQGATGTTDGGAPEEEDELTPAPQPESTREPTPEPTPEPAPAPTAEPTPLPTEKMEEEESPESDGEFAFSVGQSWNYNLASPVDTAVDVDIFFIDMGEPRDDLFLVCPRSTQSDPYIFVRMIGFQTPSW